MEKRLNFSPNLEFFIDKSEIQQQEMKNSHFHKQYELYYLVKGSIKYLINNTIHIVNAGDLVLVEKDILHKSISFNNEIYERIVINYTESLLNNFSQELKDLNLNSIFHTEVPVLTLCSKDKLHLESLLNNILQINAMQSDSFQILSKVLLCELLITIKGFIKLQHINPKANVSNINSKIQNIIEYINENYCKDLSLTSIANHFSISTFYLSKLFKQSTNLSLIEYINSVRIKEAKKLLETTPLSISIVTKKVGFCNTTHFSRTFKVLSGMSPQQYKKYCSKI